MARNWYVRGNDGDALNSGGTDAAAAELSLADLVVSGTGASSVTGGFSGVTCDSINIQVGGADEIRTFTVSDDNNIVLSGAPSAGDGTYSCKVGGARVSVAKVVNNGANNNAVLAAADKVWVRPKTGGYNELAASNLSCGVASLGGEVTFDGTGLGAGSDPISSSGADWTGFYVTAAVDGGFVRTGGNPQFQWCRCSGSGGIGITNNGTTSRTVGCEVLSGSSIGIAATPGNGNVIDSCVVGGCSSTGVNNPSQLSESLIYECALGVSVGSSGPRYLRGNSILYNTGDGVDYPTAAVADNGSTFVNNLVAFNGGYGADSSAGTPSNRHAVRNNHYYSNTSGNRNWFTDTEGYEGPTGDPLFVAVASDDYRLQPSSPDAVAGLGPTGLYLPVGAVPVVDDYPAAADVEEGVDYAQATLTGTFVVPAEEDVENGVTYGDSAEFTGSLVASSSGGAYRRR